MFDDNWILYLFIIMVLFGRDGEIAGTELIVLFASTLAVLIGETGTAADCFRGMPTDNNTNDAKHTTNSST